MTSSQLITTESHENISGLSSATTDRAVELLGSGISAEQVAMALGVSASRISQLMSQESFAARVQELRFNNLQEHTARDSKYNRIEDVLLDKLEMAVQSGMVYQPMQLTTILSKINAAQRRGVSAPQQTINQQTVVQLVLPTQIQNKFTKDHNNRVIEAGDQTLITMPSGNLQKLLKDSENHATENSRLGVSNAKE